MIVASSIDRKRLLRFCICCMTLAFIPIVPAAAQQADQLQQQLDQLKQQYEATTEAMQLRMAALAQQIQSQKEASEKEQQTKVSAIQLATEHAAQSLLGNSNEGGAKFQ